MAWSDYTEIGLGKTGTFEETSRLLFRVLITPSLSENLDVAVKISVFQTYLMRGSSRNVQTEPTALKMDEYSSA